MTVKNFQIVKKMRKNFNIKKYKMTLQLWRLVYYECLALKLVFASNSSDLRLELTFDLVRNNNIFT